MDPSKKSALRTNIIDDIDAIAIAHQGQQKGTFKKKKSPTGGLNLVRPQIAGSSKPRSVTRKNTKKSAGSHYYNRDESKIQLYEKSGKVRPHARLSGSLRNKNTDYLLDIVEEYAGADKKQEFKDANRSKAEIADWIEAKETLALGPHPQSKLTLAGNSLDAVDKDTILTHPEPKQTYSKGRAKAKVLVEKQGKRKRHYAPELGQALLQTTKKLKTHHSNRQLAEQPLEGHTQIDAKSKDSSCKVRPREVVEEPKEPEELPIVLDERTGNGMDQTHEAANLQNFMYDIGMHPENPHTSTMVITLPEYSEDRVLTAITNTKTGQTILHDTPVSRVCFDPVPRAVQAYWKPFLKVGRHGRGGDFEDDCDRQTGRGHEVSQEAYTGLDEYMNYRGQVFRKYPRYPRVGEGEAIHSEVKKSSNENELWYVNFKKTYPGFSVSHLWPCGCEKLRRGSENEESEQE